MLRTIGIVLLVVFLLAIPVGFVASVVADLSRGDWDRIDARIVARAPCGRFDWSASSLLVRVSDAERGVTSAEAVARYRTQACASRQLSEQESQLQSLETGPRSQQRGWFVVRERFMQVSRPTHVLVDPADPASAVAGYRWYDIFGIQATLLVAAVSTVAVVRRRWRRRRSDARA